MRRLALASLLAPLLLLAGPGAGRAQTTLAPEPGINPMGLSADHVTASVDDLDRESAWYRRVFGMQLVSRNKVAKDMEVLQLGIPGFRIDLVKKDGSTRQHQTSGYFTQGWLHVVFRTPAVDAAFRRLQDQGTDVAADRGADGAIFRLVVHDPEGNEVEVVPLTSPQVAAPKAKPAGRRRGR